MSKKKIKKRLIKKQLNKVMESESSLDSEKLYWLQVAMEKNSKKGH